MYSAVGIINRKRLGEALSRDEIEYFISGYTDGGIPDYQMSALLMAICINGMTSEETYNLTDVMLRSGDTLKLDTIPGCKLDKHSTGGIGDKTTLIIGPIAAALGIKTAKMSGRGLGATGGTIDKLDSIPGFSSALSMERFTEVLNDVGFTDCAQTLSLAPADKKIYALRDVTATVESIPLIASSIMSKKLAIETDGILIDVKCGSGAFMKDEASAEALAREMIGIGRSAGRRMTAVITDMNEPLGYTVGNSLEVLEAAALLRYFAGNEADTGLFPAEPDERLVRLVTELSVRLLMMSDSIASELTGDVREKHAHEEVERVLTSGEALSKFRAFVKAQGGDDAFIDDPSMMSVGAFTIDICADRDGYISSCDAERVGEVSMLLGAGRQTKDDEIDSGAGVVVHCHVGDSVKTGDRLMTLYTGKEDKLSGAAEAARGAYNISGDRPCVGDIINLVVED